MLVHIGYGFGRGCRRTCCIFWHIIRVHIQTSKRVGRSLNSRLARGGLTRPAGGLADSGVGGVAGGLGGGRGGVL